jgi:hypothetical protein
MIKPEQIPPECIQTFEAMVEVNSSPAQVMAMVLTNWPNAKHRAHGLIAPSLVLPIEEIKPMKEDPRAIQALKDIIHAKEEHYKRGITLETADMEQYSYENARRIVKGLKKLLPYPPPSRRGGSE